MPIIRKVTTVGAARGITLPKSWIECIERETGQKLKEVMLEVNKTLTVTPVLQRKEDSCLSEQAKKEVWDDGE
jgi:antitoxin component of MazEF toxin-antitoxin module